MLHSRWINSSLSPWCCGYWCMSQGSKHLWKRLCDYQWRCGYRPYPSLWLVLHWFAFRIAILLFLIYVTGSLTNISYYVKWCQTVPLAAIKNAYNSCAHDICNDWFDFDTNGCSIKKDSLDDLVFEYFGDNETNTIKFQGPVLIDGEPSSTYYRLEYGGESPACDNGNCRGPHYCTQEVAEAGNIWGMWYSILCCVKLACCVLSNITLSDYILIDHSFLQTNRWFLSIRPHWRYVFNLLNLLCTIPVY